jgi:stalled ribosome rescue protein Dom34
MAIVIVGPGTAKESFNKYLTKRRPTIAARVASIGSAGRLSTKELLDFARRRFRAIDQLHGSSPRLS